MNLSCFAEFQPSLPQGPGVVTGRFYLIFILISVKLKFAVPGGIYFITITRFKWLPLFDIADSYDAMYKWFQYLKRTFPVDTIMDIMDIDLSKRM